MEQIPCSWLSPKLESRTKLEKGGNGVYALEAIKKGELVAMFGGTVMIGEQLESLSETLRSLSIQVEEDLYLISTIIGPGDHVNHSCDPNLGLDGQIGLIAMRDIAIGEEANFDYAMSDSSDYDEFSCACGTDSCRGKISGEDWKNPELWEKYEGYFSPYIARKIKALASESTDLADIPRNKL